MTEKMDEKTLKAVLEFMDQFASLNADNMRKVFDYIGVLKRSQEIEVVSPEKREPRPDKKEYRCSFCGKSESQAERMIMGPGVLICDECVRICGEILKEEFEKDPAVLSRIPRNFFGES